MDLLQVLGETLASFAAFIAIVATLISWYRSVCRPLKVTRVVVQRGKDKSTFILIVKNVKQYPVLIKRVDAYKRKKYQVQRKLGGVPEYAELFPGSQKLFSVRDEYEIPANGDTDVRINVQGPVDMQSKVLFLLETSHGYHELWCKDIDVVELGRVDVYGVEYKYDFSSKALAKACYNWERLVTLKRRFSRRLRRG